MTDLALPHRNLQVKDYQAATPQIRTLSLNAIHLGGSKHIQWQRKDVSYSLTLVNQRDGPNITRTATFTFAVRCRLPSDRHRA